MSLKMHAKVTVGLRDGKAIEPSKWMAGQPDRIGTPVDGSPDAAQIDEGSASPQSPCCCRVESLFFLSPLPHGSGAGYFGTDRQGTSTILP